MKNSSFRIYEFASGNARDIPFYFNQEPEDVHMGFVWSPDSRTIMVQVNFEICTLLPQIAYIIRIDIQTFEQVVLLENDGTEFPWYSVIEWSEADKVVLSLGGNYWYLNPWTGEVSSESD